MTNKSKANNDKKGNTRMQWAVALIVNSISLMYGLENGWISPTAKILQSETSPAGQPLSDNAIAWIASSFSMAAVIGAPIYSILADVYGRRLGVILIALLQAVGWLIKISYTSTATLLIARTISGFSAGGVFNVIPMYVKEISQDDMRGILGSLVLFMVNIGVLFIYVVGAYLDYHTVLYIVVCQPIIVGLVLFKVPESPGFLVKKGKIEEAKDTIALLRGLDRDDKIVKDEVEYMKKEDEYYKMQPNLSYIDILKNKGWRRGVILVFITFTFHDLNGSFAILTYGSTIIASTGVELNVNPDLQILAIPLLMIIASLTLTVFVERCGRKVLLSGSFFVSAVALCTLGAAILVQQRVGDVPGWLPLLAVMVTMTMYAGGVSPLSYIIMTELFPYQIRAKVLGCLISYGWFFSFLTVAIYVPMSSTFGQHSAFFFYSAMNLCGAIFVSVFLPETVGKSDEEIQKILTGKEKSEEQRSI